MTALAPSTLFGRVWKVRVDDLDLSALDVEFRLLRSLKPEPNRAMITLWNLNQEHRAYILKRYQPGGPNTKTVPVNAQIEAGYQGQTSVLFSGDLREVVQHRDNTDWKTILTMDDGGAAVRESRFPNGGMKFAKGTPVGQVLKQACTYLGIGLGNAAQFEATAEITGASQQNLPHGMTLSGNVYKELNRVCQSVGLNCSIQAGVLQILPKGKALGTLDTAIVLSADTVLIDSPEAAVDSTISLGFAKTAKGTPATTPPVQHIKNTAIIKAKALLIPGLVPGRMVLLDSVAFPKQPYVISQVEYNGQSFGNDWYATMVLRYYG